MQHADVAAFFGPRSRRCRAALTDATETGSQVRSAALARHCVRACARCGLLRLWVCKLLKRHLAAPRSSDDMSQRDATVELTAAGIAAREEVTCNFTNAPLLSRIFDNLRGPDLWSAEQVSAVWRRTIANGGYWRRLTMLQFPSVAAYAALAPTPGLLMRASHVRRARAEEHRQPTFLYEQGPDVRSAHTELCRDFRWTLELRDSGGATMFSTSFRVLRRHGWGPLRVVNGCMPTSHVLVHDTAPDAPRLSTERLTALAEQQARGDFGDCAYATLFVERQGMPWSDKVYTAVVSNARPMCVCVHPEQGYAVLTVGTTCCETECTLALEEEEFNIRRFREDDSDESTLDDFDNPLKWLYITPAFILLLPISHQEDDGNAALSLSPPNEPQCWLNFVTASGHDVSDTTPVEMLTLLRSLDYITI